MFGNSLPLGLLLGGSMTSFRHREHPESGQEAFKELQREKERAIRKGIDQLRRLRTEISGAADSESQQKHFASAMNLANQIADYCLADSQDRAEPLTHHSYHAALADSAEALGNVEPQSKHHIVPTQVAYNLRRAAGDMIIRLEEKVGSLSSPSRALNVADARGVLQEFLVGTNCLTIDAQKGFFSNETVVGGIMSGGLVYALMASKIIQRYGEDALSQMKVIAVAVNSDGKKAFFESDGREQQITRLILTDDMIDKGGSMHCAMKAAEDIYISADIYSGVRTSYAKGRIPPSQAAHLDHLACLFQDFADFTESGQFKEARALLIAATDYALEHGVTLQRGWFKRAARHIPDAAEIMGKDPYA
jgi:hypothetical protein